MRYLIPLLALLACGPARAQITIAVEPVQTRAPAAGGSFTVEVHFKDYVDLYSYSVELFYNTAALTHTAITQGPIFNSAGGQVMLTAGSNAAQGRILVDHTVLGPLTGVTGADAVGFSATFDAVAPGGSDLFYGVVKVRNSDNVDMAFVLEAGVATVVSPLPAASASRRYAASATSAAFDAFGTTGVRARATNAGTGGTVTAMRYAAEPPGGDGEAFSDPDATLTALAVPDGYWEVTSSLAGSVNVDLAFDPAGLAGPSDPAAYRVARRALGSGAGTAWTLLPAAATSVDGGTGEVVVDGAVGTYGSGQYALVFELPVIAMDGVEGWRMFGMTAEGQTYDTYLGPLWTQGFTGADGVPTDPFHCNAFVYDPLWVNEAVLDHNGDGLISARDGWRCIGDQGAAFGRGEAVMVYVFADDDNDGSAEGFPKSLTVPTPFASAPHTFTGLAYADNGAIDNDQEGFNFRGNPLDQAFDWDLLTDGVDYNDLNGTVYVYDPAYNTGDYRTRNASVGDLTDGLVPSFQGFVLQATGPSPALTIPEAAVGGSPPFLGRTAPPRALRFEVQDVESDGPVAAAFLQFDDVAAPGVDRLDSYRLAPVRWPYVILYSAPTAGADTNGDGVAEHPPLVKNALPLPTAAPTEIPLAVEAAGQASASVPLRLVWEGLGSLPATWRVELIDTQTGARVDLRAAGAYTFEVAPTPSGRARSGAVGAPGAVFASDAGARFVLSVADEAGVATEPPSALARLSLSARPNPAASRSTLAYTLPEAGPVRLTLVDLLGREVAVVAEGPRQAGEHQAVLEGGRLPTGLYLLRLDAPSGVETLKLVLTR